MRMIPNGPILSPSRSLQPSSDPGASITHSTSSPIPNFPRLKLKTLIPKLFRNRPPSASGPLPPELIQAVIDNADSYALLKLSLVSRYASKRARIRLFHTLDFDYRKEFYGVQENEDGTIKRIQIHRNTWTRLVKCRFDRFLDMIQNPKNTIANNIRILSIDGLFRNWDDRYHYKTRKTDAMIILASRLSQLSSLRLKINHWNYIPRHILEFFLRLQVAEVKIENVLFGDPPSFSKLFQSPLINGASNNLSLYCVRVIPALHLAAHSHTFSKQLHFSFIDDFTLVNFCKVWDLSITRPQITINSLCLAETGFFDAEEIEVEVAFDFLATLSRYVGPSIKCLYVSVSDLLRDEDVQNIFNRFDPSCCTGLRAVHFGVITMLDKQAPAMNAVRQIIHSLPSLHIETVGLILNVCSFRDLDDLIDIVAGFPWVSTAKALVDAIPSLKRIKFTLGHPYTRAEFLYNVDCYLQAIATNISDALETTVEVVLEGRTWTGIPMDDIPWRLFALDALDA
ncbi:hypothetical protein H0H92_008620 [Tricholoma furcatifolium]|nr:hypothetical protein H0H92_008620 [Tricholoma furcatifolium]